MQKLITTRIDYLSWWIANLGVVPLFLFSAFLTAPLFFFLFLRIIFVCLVFDAITTSHYIIKLRSTLLAVFCVKVKSIFAILIYLVIIFPSNSPLMAINNKYLAIGEQILLPFAPHSHFSIGNKQILRGKYLRGKSQLLIKGEKEGHSDLIVWNKKTTQIYKFIILNNSPEIIKANLISYLGRTKLSYADQANSLIINEPIHNLASLSQINHYCSELKNEECLYTMSPDLQKEVITKVYEVFLYNNHPEVFCEPSKRENKILCHYQSHIPISFNKQIEEMAKEYKILFKREGIRVNQNIKVSFHIIQVDIKNQFGSELGLSHINSTLAPILNHSSSELIQNNQIIFQNDFMEAKMLAKPEVMTMVDVPNLIKIGQENSYESSAPNALGTNSIQWKFAGFLLNFTLMRQDQHMVSDYQITLSNHNEEGIKETFKKSKLIVVPESPNFLFKIEIDNQSYKEGRHPIFSGLPLVGKLFRRHSQVKNKQYMIAYLTFKYIEDNYNGN